ncbi:MAG: hypothetical protein IJ081_07715 [Prevotella sp.]|nr:hypothetical protein [Prevotella sp.]
MKKLICSLVFILIGLFTVDRAGGLMMRWVGEHTNDVLGPKLRYLHHDIHEEVVLMGASRCHHHYLPSVLSDTLGMSVYNAGVGGSDNIFSHFIVLCHILERYTPKVICLEVMHTDYCQQEDAFTVLSYFAPLYGNSEAADSVYRLAGKYWQYQVSHLYRYNAKAASNLVGLVLNRQKDNDQGYIPLPKPNQCPQQLAVEQARHDVDSLKIEYLQRFIDLCRDRQICLVFTVSPKYTLVDADHYQVLREMAQKNQVPMLDYHTTGLYHNQPAYFKDITHLWDKGARLYSAVFASDLKHIVQEY